MFVSIEELCEQGTVGDVLLEAHGIQINVDISIERVHVEERDAQDGGLRIVTGEGFLVSFLMPVAQQSQIHLPRNVPVLFNGETQMEADLHYLGEETSPLPLNEVLAALGLSAKEKVWTVQAAP